MTKEMIITKMKRAKIYSSYDGIDETDVAADVILALMIMVNDNDDDDDDDNDDDDDDKDGDDFQVPPSGQGIGGWARTRDRGIPAGLRAAIAIHCASNAPKHTGTTFKQPGLNSSNPNIKPVVLPARAAAAIASGPPSSPSWNRTGTPQFCIKRFEK
ncbi:hypothetical protein PoB_002890700 [Plakobranchus ocellatus]|uniref:Uncharacterized protein n=1 Tax=Plakobranchus ocellatus TaxID=259542 RepID=A0AAV4A679_9GAST|nr:hypothetical protein PoB_002890700 [Plakobranchus ocellatus]